MTTNIDDRLREILDKLYGEAESGVKKVMLNQPSK